MSIVVEDNTGKINANSYVSIESVEQYLAARGVEFDSKKLPFQLVIACDFIRSYSQRFVGKKLNPVQGLDFPRVLSRNETLDVPGDIKLAQMELVKMQIQNPALFEIKTMDDFIIREKIDILDTTFSENAMQLLNTYAFGNVRSLISQFTTSSKLAGQFKVVRG